MSKFRVRFTTEIYDCPCGISFTSRSCREMNMKLRLHRKFCSKVSDTTLGDPSGYDKTCVIRGNYML